MNADRSRDDVRTLHNKGVVLAESGAADEALAYFDRALAVAPDYIHAYVNKGGALQSLGRLGEAAESYGRALELQPDLYAIHLRQALVFLALDRIEEAQTHFGRTRAIRRDPEAMGRDHPSFARTSRLKLAHDSAQFRYLATEGIEPDRFGPLAECYERAAAGIDGPAGPADEVDLPDEWRRKLASIYNGPLYLSEAADGGDPVLNSALDGAAITTAFRETAPGIAVVDDLLTPDALARFRRFLLESVIWHDFTHIGGHLAAYLEDGLACPLLLRLVVELRHRLPGLLGPHPLQQAWAFKGLGGNKGIDVHADAGAVSVNLWVTPDEANLAPGTGGLVIHRQVPPPDWPLTDYDRDIVPIRLFLAESEEDAVTVPHRANRAILFRSDLFHESGPVRFRPGHENHRINITLLFGTPEGTDNGR